MSVLELLDEKNFMETGFLVLSLLLALTIFWFYFFLKMKKDALEQIFLSIRANHPENIPQDNAQLNQRVPQRVHPVYRLYSFRHSDRANENLYQMIQYAMDERDGISFVGPNGDTNEYLSRDDLDGIYVRSRNAPRPETNGDRPNQL